MVQGFSVRSREVPPPSFHSASFSLILSPSRALLAATSKKNIPSAPALEHRIASHRLLFCAAIISSLDNAGLTGRAARVCVALTGTKRTKSGYVPFFSPKPLLPHHTLLRHQSLLPTPLAGYAGDLRGIVPVPGTETDQGVGVVGTCPGNCFDSPRSDPASHAHPALALLSAPRQFPYT